MDAWSFTPTARRRLALATLLVAAAAVFCLPVGRRPLHSQDEARFALLAQEVLEGGQWALVRVRDVVYLNKPPLFFRSIALVSWPFRRVSEATAAVPSVLSALVTLVAVFAIGRRLWGWSVGMVAALVLATTPFFFVMAHEVVADMMLTAWLTWALYFFLAAQDLGGRWSFLVAFYLCVGGGLATKGPGALLALVASMAVAVAQEGRAGLRRLKIPMGVAILLLSALPWLVPYLLQGERYTRGVLVGHYLDWYFRSKPDSRIGDMIANFLRFLPWALFLVPAGRWWWRSPDPGCRRLLVWTATLVVGIGLSGEQRSRYFTPVLPLLALLVADYLVRGAAGRSWHGRRAAVGVAVVLLLGSIAAGVAFLTGATDGVRGATSIFLPSASWERWTVPLLAVAGSGGALIALRSGRGAAAATSLALALAAVLAVEGVTYPARHSRWFDVRSFADGVNARLPTGSPVMAYPEASLIYDFYLGRPVREIRRQQDVVEFLAAPRASPLLTAGKTWRALAETAHESWRPVVWGTIAGREMVLVGSQP